MKSKIYVNRLGYITHLSKKASVCGGGKSFELVTADTGKTMYAGMLSDYSFDEASGEKIAEADFSGFSLRGKYRVKCGRKLSPEFVIDDNPYKEFKNSVLRAFYFNRCGIVDGNYAGELAHKPCHLAKAQLFNNPGRSIDVTGGWHDSGSYGKYTVATCIALGHMLNAFLFFPDTFNDKINLPDNSSLPDILAECRFGLEWLLKMQAKDGGVFHKVVTLESSPFLTPDLDTKQQYVFPASHQATACFTAVCALAAGIFARYDTDFSDLLQSAAFSGWIWITNHPLYKPYENPIPISHSTLGDIPDKDYTDDLFWAVCELYAMTGEKLFSGRIEEMYKIVNCTGFTWGSVGGFGSVAYLRCHQAKNSEVERSMRLQFRIDADNLYSIAEKSGFDTVIMPDDYILGSNIKILTGAVTLISAYMILHCDDYIRAAAEQLNYILGKNPMDIIYSTGFGEHSVINPHHRMCAFDEIDEVVPGMIVVGPDRGRNDEFAKWNIPHDTPSAKCYYDIGLCYSSNEANVLCNSAALFVTAFFDSPDN